MRDARVIDDAQNLPPISSIPGDAKRGIAPEIEDAPIEFPDALLKPGSGLNVGNYSVRLIHMITEHRKKILNEKRELKEAA